MIDPCASATLTIATNPFASGPFTYVLTESQVPIFYNNNALVTSDALVNCGTPVIEFMTDDDMTIDTVLFDDIQAIDGNYQFNIGPTNLVSKKGDYQLKWIFYYSNSSSNRVVSPIFIV